MIVNDMTSIRINWLQAFEKAMGRKIVVTRQELLAFHATAAATGPLGMPLKYPSWLTNPKPNKWKVGRAAYRLPWDELDAWNSLATPTAPPAAQPAAPATDTPPTTVAFTVAEIHNNVEVSA